MADDTSTARCGGKRFKRESPGGGGTARPSAGGAGKNTAGPVREPAASMSTCREFAVVRRPLLLLFLRRAGIAGIAGLLRRARIARVARLLRRAGIARVARLLRRARITRFASGELDQGVLARGLGRVGQAPNIG